jgi:hypothetical protein
MQYRSWGEATADGALFFHHTRDIAHVAYDIAIPCRPHLHMPEPRCASDEVNCWTLLDEQSEKWHDHLYFDACYRWLAERVGFWPLWLAVGAEEETLRMTGYDNQFQRCLTRSRDGNTHRQAGDAPSYALFSWRQPPPGIRYLDYDNWCVGLLNSAVIDHHRSYVRDVPAWLEKGILRRSWKDSDWLRRAIREVYSTQAVAPQLDLRSADLVRVRNKREQARLRALGFGQVEVWRMKTERW